MRNINGVMRAQCGEQQLHLERKLELREGLSRIFELCLFLNLFIFLATTRSIWDLPPPGIKPVPPALGARSLNHWTTREVPELCLKRTIGIYQADKGCAAINENT